MGADPVLVKKEGKTEPRLTFNYHYVWEEPPGNQMQLSADAHAFLSRPTHQVFSQFDLKNAYWTVQIHPDDRHFLAFSVPGIGQLQPTRMAQGARTSSFTMNELGNLAFGAIPDPDSEPSFLHGNQPGELPQMTFYIDDMFPAHSSWDHHWRFIKFHLLPRLLWAKLRLSFSKIKIGMDQIVALGETHLAGGRIAPKPDRVRTLLDWPQPQNQTEVRALLGTALTIRPWIKNYAEIARPLTQLTGKVEWQWGESEQLAFTLIKNKAATAVLMFGWDSALPIEFYVDASKFAGGLFVRQLQNDRWVPILYDSFTFSPTERNYGVYKRELKAMVVFATRHAHMLQGPRTSTIWTDHEPLTGFLNSDTHEDIYYRFLEKLRPLNIRIEHIEGTRNVAADGISRTIFPDDCGFSQITHDLLKAAEQHDVDGKRDWFWKSGKGGHEEMLKNMKKSQQATEGETLEAHVCTGWTTFGNPTPINTEVYVQKTKAASQSKSCYNKACHAVFEPNDQRIMVPGVKGPICEGCRGKWKEEKDAAEREGREMTDIWKWRRCSNPWCKASVGGNRKGFSMCVLGLNGETLCAACAKRQKKEDQAATKEGRPMTDEWRRPIHIKRQINEEAARAAEEHTTPTLGNPTTCREQHAQCDISLCRHLCCRSKLWTLEQARSERQRVDNVPTTAASGYWCKNHDRCNKAICAHACCRVQHHGCAQAHMTCLKDRCNHPCYRIARYEAA